MRYNILGIFAVVALLSACATASEETSSTEGSGTQASQPAQTGGAAAAAVAEQKLSLQDELVVKVGDRVFFGFDQFNLNDAARATLGKQAAWLSSNPSVSISIEGHADERGTREYNLALGDRRANSAKDYLVALGVNPNRIKTISYGKERPVALGSNEAAWAQNRRGVTVVNGSGS